MNHGRLLIGIALAGALSAAWPARAWCQEEQPPAPAGPSTPPPENRSEPPPLPPPEEKDQRERGPLTEPPAFQGPFANLMGPAVGHLVPRVDYRATWFPDEEVRGQPTNLGYVQQNLSAVFPIWQDPCDEWSLSVHVGDELFHTSAILPDTRRPFPDDLWNIRFSTSYRYLFSNGWIGGGGLSVGTASDKPFHSINEMTVGVNAFLRVPQGEHNAWLFSLSYSPTSELPFPIPGVAFIYQPTDYLRLNIGLPFAVWYRPWDDLTVELSYMLLRTVHARAVYRVCAPVRVYAGFDWSNESYFLADRFDENDRFFYYEKRLSAGVQVFLRRQALLDISSGYVFDRFYFQGHQYNDLHHDRIDVGSGPLLGLRFELRY